jgi:uncharacterized membrane protein YdbT with pleckstrin-like domain
MRSKVGREADGARASGYAPLVDLRSGETVIFQGHPSWRAILGFYFKWLLVAAVAGGLAALVTAVGDELNVGIIVVVVAVVMALAIVVGLVKRIATTYSITNQRLHIKRGIIARKIQQTRIERVQNVNITQSAIERVLQVGTVDFDTAGTDDSEFSFVGVAQPEQVMAAVEQAQHEASHAGGGDAGLGDQPQPATPPPPPPAAGPAS